MRKIPEGDVLEILQAVEAPVGNPFPISSTKLIGTVDLHRIRVEKYRVIYEVQGNELVIEVIRAGHRKDVYR